MKRLNLITFTFLLSVVPSCLFAQTSTQGKDFIISFGDIRANPVTKIQIVTSEVTNVSFKYNNNSTLNDTVTIPAGKVQQFDLTSIRNDIVATTTASNTTMEIHADTTISVYILNGASNSGDATAVLPYTALGTEYYHASFTVANGQNYDAFIVAAIENGTIVYRNGTPVGTLNAGQSIRYSFAVNVDGTGTHVTSNNPIAYFMSNHNAQIGSTNMIMEQQMPINRWGTAFLVPIVQTNERIRIIASQPGTTIQYWRHTSPVSTNTSIASAGGRLDLTANAGDSTFWILSDNPVAVYTYLSTVPAISQIPPVQQSVSSTVVAPFNTVGTSLSLNNHYAIIVTPSLTCTQTKYVEGSGTEIPLSSWTAGANGGTYSYATMSLNPDSSYLFKNNFGVIVWVYGMGNNASYYYLAGAATRELTDRFYLDSIGDINGQTFCFDKMIEITADLMLPLSPQPGHLKWFLNSVEQISYRDSFTWTLPFLPNGLHTISLEALDVFDSIHVLTATFTQACPQTIAVPDTVSVLSCIPEVTIDILANDSLGMCSFSSIEVILPSATSAHGGSAYINSDKQLVYTPPPNFPGLDSIEYLLFCDDTLSAKVYIFVMECPDNIDDDAKCFGNPPQTAWDIKVLDSTNLTVHIYAQPLLGDIDGCGSNEVITFNYISGASSSSDALLIFDEQLQHKASIPIPSTYCYLSFPVAIADVDRDGKAEIFVLTGNTTSRTLNCYYYNGTTYTAKPGFTPHPITIPVNAVMPAIVIGDINGDGIPELLVYDRIINSQTGGLIAMLPAASMGGYNAYATSIYYVYYTVLADVDNDGVLDIVCGNRVYKAQINNGSTSGTITPAYQAPAGADILDGFTSVADIDLDGYLDVVVTYNDNNVSKAYVWSPYKGVLLGQTLTGNSAGTTASRGNISRAFIGDVDNDGYPEIAFSYHLGMVCYKFDTTANVNNFVQLCRHPTTDESGMTTMSMFDFNQDGKQEIVYRDETFLRIVDGETGLNVDSFYCYSGTASELPIVVDFSREGHAQILVSGASTYADRTTVVRIFRYTSSTPGAWAPARKIWNQHGYNAVNINEDLTVPRYQLNPATVFPNGQRPYNGFLMQQTRLNINGDPLWPLPNIDTTSLISTTVTDTDLIITIGIVNKGDAQFVPPVYVAVYKESSPQTYNPTDTIGTGSDSNPIARGDTAYITVTIPITNITSKFPMANLVIRVNDDGTTFPFREECDTDSNEVIIPNPLRYLMMKKDATLFITPVDSIEHNGYYSNPVAVYYRDTIEYKISVGNGYLTPEVVHIIDTLPAWLNYITSDPLVTPNMVGVNPIRSELHWWFPAMPGMTDTVVTVTATPYAGVNASQPLFANQAWVTIRGEHIPTNYTWHQGTGISIVTFTAGFGGIIYNATEQVLDYRTSPLSGIVIVPDEGYRFTGWSHPDYISLRGETIEAQNGIMRYETLTIYGDVELHANFEREESIIDSVVLQNDRHIDIQAKLSEKDKIWSAENELHIRTSQPGSIVRIYSMAGVLQKQQVILTAGETKIKLPGGMYVVALNNGIGQVVNIR